MTLHNGIQACRHLACGHTRVEVVEGGCTRMSLIQRISSTCSLVEEGVAVNSEVANLAMPMVCHTAVREVILICSLYVRRRQRFPSYWWRSSSASTSRRSGCQPHRRSTTHHHSIRICPHFPLAVPLVRLHGARSRIYIRANGQVLDGQKYVAAWSQVLCRPARVGGVQYLAIYPRGEEGQEGYGHVQSKNPGL